MHEANETRSDRPRLFSFETGRVDGIGVTPRTWWSIGSTTPRWFWRGEPTEVVDHVLRCREGDDGGGADRCTGNGRDRRAGPDQLSHRRSGATPATATTRRIATAGGCTATPTAHLLPLSAIDQMQNDRPLIKCGRIPRRRGWQIALLIQSRRPRHESRQSWGRRPAMQHALCSITVAAVMCLGGGCPPSEE